MELLTLQQQLFEQWHQREDAAIEWSQLKQR
jgi:hypothetical protein